MGKLFLTICILLVSLLATGCGQTIVGEMKLTGDKKIPLVDVNGALVELGAGHAVMNFTGFTKPRLEIESAGVKATIKIPRKAVTQNTKNFYIHAERINQSVDLDATTRFDLLDTREVFGTASCFGPGYCYGPCYGYGCGPYYSPYPGYPYPGYGYGYAYRPDCPGSREVKRTVETRREVLSIAFREASVSDKPVLGMFDADRGTFDDVVQEEPLSGCRVH